MTKNNDKKTLLMPTIITVSVLAVGFIYMLAQWQYAEEWHDALLITFGLLSVPLFFTALYSKKSALLGIFILMFLVVAYADIKFEWKKDYIENANSGDYFLLDPYIDQYPTFEQHTFASLTNTPKYMKFNEECFKPALKNRNIVRTCNSNNLILDTYGLNIEKIINTQFKRMQATARRIEQGRLKSKNQYNRCIISKQCALIPLLPAGVDVNDIESSSNEYTEIRNMFWSLINDKEISPEICEFMTLCRAMRNIEVIAIKPSKIYKAK